jgi:hypothetical protein
MRHGLPSKYAKLGFKKGWPAYRASQRGHGQTKKTAHKPKHKARNPINIFQLSAPHTPKKGSHMKISKIRLSGMADKTRRALAKVRELKSGGALEVGIGLGEAAVGALGSSWLVGLIPVPATMARPGLIKSGAQALIGTGLAVTMYKNKHLRFVGFGAGLMGVIGLARELLPLPQFAGEVDAAMYGNPEFETMGDPLEGAPLSGPLEGDPLEGDPMEGDNSSNEFSPGYMGGNANPWGESGF